MQQRMVGSEEIGGTSRLQEGDAPASQFAGADSMELGVCRGRFAVSFWSSLQLGSSRLHLTRFEFTRVTGAVLARVSNL